MPADAADRSEAVALGPGGVIEGSRVKIFIDMSTTGATYAKRIAEGLRAKGIAAVDAPISGGLVGAERGTLAVMVSCERRVCTEDPADSGSLRKDLSSSVASPAWDRR